MAARRKSAKKGATATPRQKTTSAPRKMRGSAAKSRSSKRTSKPIKAAVKPKEKAAALKRGRKRSGSTSRASQSAAKSSTKAGKRSSPAKTKKKGDHAAGKASKTAGAPNTKQREARLQTKIQQKSETKVATRASMQDSKTRAAAPELHNTISSSSPSEASVMKAASSVGKEQRPGSRETQAVAKATKPAAHRQGFKLNEFVVYPAHGVGQIVAIEEQEVAGFKLELFVISFSKDKMTLRVPTSKGAGVGMRKISDPDTAKRSLEILTGRARVKRTMWSRRAQEYEAKINSGDINAIAEVVRDLYRSDAQPEQSYSERQLYEAALDRMVREIAAVQRTSELDALRTVEAQLQKSASRSGKTPAAAGDAVDPEIEEAA
jgi:CarD family transcriptional regulator, regulator of rRNA transcription